jgi:hypothetical protein
MRAELTDDSKTNAPSCVQRALPLRVQSVCSKDRPC